MAVILEPVYRRGGDLNKLVGALDAQLESADDRAERVRILGEMAEIHQRLGRLDLAFDCRSRAWLADVESMETLAAMESLGLGAKLHAPLVVALQKRAVEAIDPDLQAQLWAASAKLLESPLGRAAEAIEAWRAALAARPDERDIFLALERLLAGAGRSSELVEILERHLEIAVDGDERKVIAKRIAVLYEDALKESERAVRAWETVLEIDPNEAEALESLAQLHLAAGAFRELAEVYARKIEITDRADERRMLFMQSARIYEENLSEPDRAIEQLRALLVETPGDGEALTDLDRILTAEGRQTDLVEVLDARAAGVQDPAARDELAFRAARLVETELGDVEGAIGRYAKILAAGAEACRGARRALRDRARRRLPAARGRGPRADRAGRQGLGRRDRASRAAPRRRGRGPRSPGAARRDRPDRGDRAARRADGVRRLGARADRGRHRRRAARGAGASGGGPPGLGAPGRRLRRAHGRHLRRRPAAHAGHAAGLALRERALRSEPGGRLSAQGAVAAG